MRTLDLSPLFRSTIGFDRMTSLLDAATRLDDSALSYPPYNIEILGENAYRLTMAVAGFGESDLNITVQDNSLIVSGKIGKTEEDRKFLHRGIAGRAFERRFELAEHIKVSGAGLVNGLLHVELAREVPEAMKPRAIRIETKAGSKPTVIEGRAA
ncbi:MAG: Hsp20 family protein [Dongiaceae bacterium]